MYVWSASTSWKRAVVFKAAPAGRTLFRVRALGKIWSPEPAPEAAVNFKFLRLKAAESERKTAACMQAGSKYSAQFGSDVRAYTGNITRDIWQIQQQQQRNEVKTRGGRLQWPRVRRWRVVGIELSDPSSRAGRDSAKSRRSVPSARKVAPPLTSHLSTANERRD